MPKQQQQHIRTASVFVLVVATRTVASFASFSGDHFAHTACEQSIQRGDRGSLPLGSLTCQIAPSAWHSRMQKKLAIATLPVGGDGDKRFCGSDMVNNFSFLARGYA